MRVRLGGRVVNDSHAALYRRYGYGDVCCPSDVRNALKKCPQGEELIFEINSGGGSVYAGHEMYTVLRSAERETICEIQSIAGSAASVFAMGGSRVRISPVANIMIHRSSTWADGNSEDMRQAKQMLDSIDESILTAYVQRVGDKCSRETLEQMMKEETFITASRAIELGFADEMLFQDDPETAMTKAAVAMAGGMKNVMACLPNINELMQLEAAENNTTGKNPGTKEETHMTLDELRQQEPELLSQIQSEAAQAERERLQAIEDNGMEGFEDIVAEAKRNPAKTGADVASAIIARMKQQGQNYLDERQKDAKGDGVNNVGAPAQPSNGADAELDQVLDEVFGS